MKTVKLLLALSFAAGLLIDPVNAAAARKQSKVHGRAADAAKLVDYHNTDSESDMSDDDSDDGAPAASKRRRALDPLLAGASSSEEAVPSVVAIGGAGSSDAGISAVKIGFKEIPQEAAVLIGGFLKAPEVCRLSTASKWCKNLPEKRQEMIATRIIALPAGVELNDEQRKRLAEAIFKLDIAPNAGGRYEISLSVAMKELTYAVRKNNKKQCELLNQIILDFIAAYQTPFHDALAKARASLAGITTLDEARAIYNAIPVENRLQRMAFCFAWWLGQPRAAPNLDPSINLQAIISIDFFNGVHINCASLHEQPECNVLIQSIIDLVIAVINPKAMTLKNLPESMHSVLINAPELTELYINSNPGLSTLAGLHAPKLVALMAYDTGLTTLVGLDMPQLIHLEIDGNPGLSTLEGLNTPKLHILNARNTGIATLAGFNAPELSHFNGKYILE